MSSYAATGSGLALATNAWAALGAGLSARLVACTAEGRSLYRAANDALARYELYRGVDAEPDFSAAPWETFASLPHETAALDPADPGGAVEYRFVLRRRNAHNLVSRNARSWSLVLDDAGAAVAAPPSDPDEVLLEPAAAGTVRVRASYSAEADGSLAADAWLVYLTDDSGDPNPAVDEPAEVPMVIRGGLAALDWTSPASADGATVKVLVRTRRSGTPDVDSIGTTVYETTANEDGPASPDPVRLRFADLREQRQ
jgi:hypothetical protein